MLFGKKRGMEGTVLPAAEAAAYEEFKRTRREAEASLTLKRLIVDVSRRETDSRSLGAACDLAKKLGAGEVLVSPVNVVQACKHMREAGSVICLVGGTGESLPAVKKIEAKKAVACGAKEIRLVLCYSRLAGGNLSYLKREIRKVRRAARRCALTVSLEDHSLGEKELSLGVRAACEGGADGVCVRGEVQNILLVVRLAAGRLSCDCSGVENGEQLRAALRAGAARATTKNAAEIGEELYEAARAPSKEVPHEAPESTPVPVKED